MNLMKKMLVAAAGMGLTASVANACPDGLRSFNKKIEGKNACIIEDTIVGNLTLSSGFNYVLLGAVFVGKEIREKQNNGEYTLKEPIQTGKLIINPGVKIFALNPEKDETGFWKGVTLSDRKTPVQGDIKTFLTVARDSRIEVQGTEAAPVVMTSGQGAHLSQSPVAKAAGNWGGLVVNGYAKSNKCPKFEGCTVPGEANTGYYGGNDDNHDSGLIKYLQVEYGGDRIDTEKELNGVTFNSVGLGTVIENIAVLHNSDDCIEFFGGAAIGKNIFCYKALDDGIDTTDGARVFLQNGVVVASEFLQEGEKNDRHAVEADSSKKADVHARLGSSPLLVNFTFVGGKNSQGLKLRRSTDYRVVNSVMTGFDLWCLDDNGSGEVTIENNVFTGCKDTDRVKSFGDNTFLSNATSLKLESWVPAADSSLQSGAMYIEYFSEDEDLDEAFADSYDEHDYIGAIGTKNWTSWIKLK